MLLESKRENFMKIMIFLMMLGMLKPSASFGQEMVSYSIGVVHAADIKTWLDLNKSMVIFDARTKEYDDGKRLPGAKLVPYTSSEEEIQKLVPSKDTPIIVYCSNAHCPASKLLADRLLDMGYTKIYKYPDGLADWIKRGYPIEQ